MSSYFPIPPSLSLRELSLDINGSTTFLNIPNNRLKKLESIFRNIYNRKIFLGLYFLEDEIWKLIKIYICEPYDFIEVNRKDLLVKNEQMVVLVPKNINNFPSESHQLPNH